MNNKISKEWREKLKDVTAVHNLPPHLKNPIKIEIDLKNTWHKVENNNKFN